MEFIDILKYTFLIIFIATAVIGLGSLPEKGFRIPNGYRKTIFTTLILEVVAVLILLFRQELITSSVEITTSNAIEHLKSKKDKINFTINSNTDNDSLLNVSANGIIIGNLNKDLKLDFSASKSSKNNKNWDIGILNSSLGFITLEGEDGYVKWNQRDSIRRDSYEVTIPYKIKNLNFWFRIDSIIKYQNSGTKYKYYMSFGEGENVEHISWRKGNYNFKKSPDGKIYLDDEFKLIHFPKWNYDYYLKFAAGQPSTQEKRLTSVEKLNLMAIGIKLE